jgi:hypothetical protein
VRLWGITGTLDHLLTDQLMIRAEARYDRVAKDDGSDGEFFDNSHYSGGGLEPDQTTVGFEVIYNFNKFRE